MKGRLENSLTNESRTKKLLTNQEYYFTEYYYALSSSKEATTVYRYVKAAINFVDFLKDVNPDFKIEKLKRVDIDRYMDDMKYNKRTDEIKTTSDRRLANVWSLLHAFVRFLVSMEYIEKDIMEHSERPKIKNEVHRVFMEKDEITTVINNAEAAYRLARTGASLECWELRDLVALRLLMETGMRVTALVGINVEDFNFNNSTVSVIDKRGKEHVYPLSQTTINYVKKWIENKTEIEYIRGLDTAEILFISAIGKKRLSTESINNIIKKYTVDLDKKITAHKFRGTYGTTLYRETGDIYFVKECMGHSNVATTQIYVEPKADTKEKALEIMSKIMNS